LATHVEYLEAIRSARGEWTPTDFSVRPRVFEKRICIASDAHIPYHDEKLLAYMFTVCEAAGVEAIVWLGDLLDMPHFSGFDQEDKTVQFTRDLDIARRVIETAAEIPGMLRQYWSRGNHEARYLRQLRFHVGMTQLARQAGLHDLIDDGDLFISDNPSLSYLKGEWILTHPHSYGPSPLVVPGKLADKYGAHVISAHAHHYAHGVSPSGKYTVVETGGLFNPRLHQYKEWQVTIHREWQQGFWIVDNGVVTGHRGAYIAKESA